MSLFKKKNTYIHTYIYNCFGEGRENPAFKGFIGMLQSKFDFLGSILANSGPACNFMPASFLTGLWGPGGVFLPSLFYRRVVRL